ncbi:hypothetical protein BVI434_180052 [Burkholderia vietnamiensis]|nr:hypothetical protein BVI434_180052 [Burkholderia vietnamiensis]
MIPHRLPGKAQRRCGTGSGDRLLDGAGASYSFRQVVQAVDDVKEREKERPHWIEPVARDLPLMHDHALERCLCPKREDDPHHAHGERGEDRQADDVVRIDPAAEELQKERGAKQCDLSHGNPVRDELRAERFVDALFTHRQIHDRPDAEAENANDDKEREHRLCGVPDVLGLLLHDDSFIDVFTLQRGVRKDLPLRFVTAVGNGDYNELSSISDNYRCVYNVVNQSTGGHPARHDYQAPNPSAVPTGSHLDCPWQADQGVPACG